MKLRSDLHLARKAYHIIGVAIILVIYSLSSHKDSVLYISTAVLIVSTFDYLRLKHSRLNQAALNWFKPFIRGEEAQNWSAMSHLLLGAFVVIVFFPKKIGLLSLILLGVGDPFSSVFGILYGKDRIIGKKTLQGAMAGFIACTLAASVYYYNQGLMVERIILVSLITGLIGTFSELIPIGKLDDNFSFPVISATSLWLLFNIFGGFN